MEHEWLKSIMVLCSSLTHVLLETMQVSQLCDEVSCKSIKIGLYNKHVINVSPKSIPF